MKEVKFFIRTEKDEYCSDFNYVKFNHYLVAQIGDKEAEVCIGSDDDYLWCKTELAKHIDLDPEDLLKKIVNTFVKVSVE